MRALREQPRVTAANTLGAVCLVLIGVAIGALVHGGDGARMHTTQARLASAQRSLTARRAELGLNRGRIRQAAAALGRAERQATALKHTNRQLRHDLRKATRARRHAKRQP
jgi:hypothetical protein